MGQPPYCSAAYAGLCGERGCGDGAACFAWASSIPCFQDRLAFLHRHFPSRSPPSHPLHPSLCGQQQPLPWEEPSTPAPSSCAFRGTCLSVQGMYVARTVTLLPFRLPQISCSRSALNVSPLTQTVAWLWGSDPASVSLPAEGRSSPANTPGFPLSSYALPSFTWFSIFFSVGQVLLSALNWCSGCASVWRCIPDVSMERYVPHIHLLLHHLVLIDSFLDVNSTVSSWDKSHVAIIWNSLLSPKLKTFCFVLGYSWLTIFWYFLMNAPGFSSQIFFIFIHIFTKGIS